MLNLDICNAGIPKVKELIESGVISEKYNILSYASCHGYNDIVDFILTEHPELMIDPYLLVQDAIRYNNVSIVERFIDEIDIHFDEDQLLRRASGCDQIESVRLLIAAGADVHAGDDEALKNASANNSVEMTKMLIDAGADIHAENDYAFMQSNCEQIMQLLIDAVADDVVKYGYYKDALYIFNNPHLDLHCYSIPVWCSEEEPDEEYVDKIIAIYRNEK